MVINRRDIQDRAEAFALRYADAKDEDRDKQSFWKDLFELYGVDPRQIGAFEERVHIHGRPGVGKIDYFAPRKFIIEHKSLGKDLDNEPREAPHPPRQTRLDHTARPSVRLWQLPHRSVPRTAQD
jgi:hypothetical protein